MKEQYHTLRLILGDQLNIHHSWYEKNDDSCLYLIAELPQEVGYVRHHIQKICAFFAAMEQFAGELKKKKHAVLHMNLDDTAGYHDLSDLLQHLVKKYAVREFQFQQPDEYRLKEQLSAIAFDKSVTVTIFDSEHFLLPCAEISQMFPLGKPGRMEHFYRKMRKRFDILMNKEKPEGGRWNFDGENRHKLKPGDHIRIPEPLLFRNSVGNILRRVEQHNVRTFGRAEECLLWPVSRQQSLRLLKDFCLNALPLFGKYQDAMTEKSPYRWSLFHSRLSFSLNSKMLHPMEVMTVAIKYWKENPRKVSMAQIEGFVRQILGWREYVRGVYWSNMPGYKSMNALQGHYSLPEFFWDGNTRMNCMKQTIDQSLKYAYAHHIQRLMVTGNFCLLAGIDPDQVDQWYLGIYLDGIEWAELPNTRGMSQFADGGIVASKPYAASGNYINKMSDYCKNCYYRVKEKTSDDACPLNSMYWHFMVRHRSILEKNPRTALVFKGWDKRAGKEKTEILQKGERSIRHRDDL
ncbi:(6-4) photolyase [invertebrate metagenome]|uniref:(6-4) photolyase n=1 Tax=invertebrate metagenome TaxID=1711999 RepID=A0A2H9T7C9_9ZZZZ